MTRKTLGEALIKPGETDSSLAAGIYVPRFRGNDEVEVAIDQQNDIKESDRKALSEDYVGAHIKSENRNNSEESYKNSYFTSNQELNTSIDDNAFNLYDKKYLPFGENDPIFQQLELLVKGKRNEGSPTHHVLRNKDLANFVLENLLKENRFNSEENFYQQNANEKDSFQKGLYTIQDGQNYNARAHQIDIEQLKEGIAGILDKAQNDYIPYALPSVNSENLRIKNNISKLQNLGLRIDGNNQIYRQTATDASEESFGAGNRPAIPRDDFLLDASEFLTSVNEFSGVSHLGTMGVALKAAGYSFVLGTAYSLIFKLFHYAPALGSSDLGQALSFLVPPQYKTSANEYGLKGYENSKPPNFVQRLVGWGDDVTGSLGYFLKGWAAFYGFNSPPLPGTGAVSSFLLKFNPRIIADSPTYHLSIARVLLREIQSVGADPKALLGKSLKDTSASVNLRFYTMLMKLGYAIERSGSDKISSDVLGGQGLTSIFLNGNVNETSLSYGSVLDSKNIRIQRRKNIFGSTLQSERKNPLSLLNFDYLKVSKDYEDKGERFKKIKEEFRIPKEVVDAVEREIDVEYVPFTIQDLRNNELISLPAFVDSISDNFSVTYESNHGYGRIDPVHTYTKTERNIEITFHLVSFNEADHDRLYEILNMLTSMCYPQRSQGQLRVTTSSNKFHQPFSQIQTASPMVRLRLGNMISSNYSQRGLKKLFGDVLGEKFNERVRDQVSQRGPDQPIDDQHRALRETINKLKKLKDLIKNNLTGADPGTRLNVRLIQDVKINPPRNRFTRGPTDDTDSLSRAVASRMGRDTHLVLEYVALQNNGQLRFKIEPTAAFKDLLNTRNASNNKYKAAID